MEPKVQQVPQELYVNFFSDVLRDIKGETFTDFKIRMIEAGKQIG
jgi:hypothetical protein